MNLEHLYTAIERVRSTCHGQHSRESSCMRTYPVLLESARLPARDTVQSFLRVACLAHAWLPNALRLDPAELQAAVAAFESARTATLGVDASQIDPIAASLSSVVAAATVLHLANPAVFPFWDHRIEGYRLGEEPSGYHMGQSRYYVAFIEEVRELTQHPLFLTFHNDYCTAYQARLQRLRIPPYSLTEPRVVESAIAELAGARGED